MELVIGLASTAVFLVMLFVGMPKKGVSPAFMRNSAMEIFYPVTALLFFTIGVAELIVALT